MIRRELASLPCERGRAGLLRQQRGAAQRLRPPLPHRQRMSRYGPRRGWPRRPPGTRSMRKRSSSSRGTALSATQRRSASATASRSCAAGTGAGGRPSRYRLAPLLWETELEVIRLNESVDPAAAQPVGESRPSGRAGPRAGARIRGRDEHRAGDALGGTSSAIRAIVCAPIDAPASTARSSPQGVEHRLEVGREVPVAVVVGATAPDRTCRDRGRRRRSRGGLSARGPSSP